MVTHAGPHWEAPASSGDRGEGASLCCDFCGRNGPGRVFRVRSLRVDQLEQWQWGLWTGCPVLSSTDPEVIRTKDPGTTWESTVEELIGRAGLWLGVLHVGNHLLNLRAGYPDGTFSPWPEGHGCQSIKKTGIARHAGSCL
jgi:hypothetical protein